MRTSEEKVTLCNVRVLGDLWEPGFSGALDLRALEVRHTGPAPSVVDVGAAIKAKTGDFATILDFDCFWAVPGEPCACCGLRKTVSGGFDFASENSANDWLAAMFPRDGDA